MISNSGHDENGKYSYGRAGDQTGGEWQIIKWYSRPWNVVLRHKNPNVRTLLANMARQAAENDMIGYDQADRLGFWRQLKVSGYYPANIKTACEADCSAGVAAIVKATGYLLQEPDLQDVPETAYTGNLRTYLTRAGFEALTDPIYLASDRHLLPGDVLLYEGHHTAINLDTGSVVGKDGWVEEYGTWYWYRGGKRVSKEWILSDHHWYRLGTDGKMLTGWHKIYDSDGNLRSAYFEEAGPYKGAMWHEADDRQGYLEIWYVP